MAQIGWKWMITIWYGLHLEIYGLKEPATKEYGSVRCRMHRTRRWKTGNISAAKYRIDNRSKDVVR